MGRYAAELEDAVTSRESLVHLLRSQSKAMNAVVHDLSVQMEPWELEISTILHPDKQHLGVYQDERAAARAVDRQSILRYGIDASLSFPLVEYLDLLTPDQTKAAVAKGLLPPVLPANYSPAPAPVPLVTLADVQAPEPRPLPRLAGARTPPPTLELVEDSAHETQGEDEAQQARAAADAGVAPEESTTLLPRAQSTTPKSVFDFMEFQNVFLGKPGGVRCSGVGGEVWRGRVEWVVARNKRIPSQLMQTSAQIPQPHRPCPPRTQASESTARMKCAERRKHDFFQKRWRGSSEPSSRVDVAYPSGRAATRPSNAVRTRRVSPASRGPLPSRFQVLISQASVLRV